MGAYGKALVIDDEEIVRSMLRTYFETIGFSVVDAADGREGIAAFRRDSPNIVFTDLRMPNMDGFSVIETVQRESPETPVIVISGTGTENDALRAVSLGAWSYVKKPIPEMQELEITAKNALAWAQLIAENRYYKEHLEELVQEKTADLRESEARYRTLFESANDAVFLLHAEKIITCNRRAVELFGSPQSDILNRPLLSFSPLLQPDGSYSAESMSKYMNEALMGEPQFFDWKCSRQHGELFDVEISMSRVELHGTVYLQAAVRDIATRRQQNALIVTLSAAVNQSANMVIITDPDGRIIYVNPRFSEVDGHAAEKAIGQTLKILQSDLHPPEYYDQMWSAISSGRVWRGELCNRNSRNGVFWVSAAIAPVRDTLGTVTNFIAIMEDITDHKLSEERLYRQANYDSLTGLPNRFLLAEILTRAVERVDGSGENFCLLLLNINNFKYINDTLGHAQGDELLRQLSERLRTLLNKSDTLARFTGDEFVMVVRGLNDPDEATDFARKIHKVMESPFSIAHTELFVTVSIGVVTYPNGGEGGENLLRNAEAAMYRAKKQGSTVQFFTPEISAQVNERLSLESRLRKALDREEFSLHFQPQIDLTTKTVTSVETLLRWTPSGEEMVLPARFIPILEETGLIVLVGEWALRQACCQLRTWLDAGLPAPQSSVNISAWQFRSGRLAETVRQALEEYSLDSSFLCLELTESIVMHNMEETIKTLHTLADMGVRLSIDDFGTGYSSLSYLRRMPIHELKIDRSFVVNVPQDSNSAAIVNTILSMAESLNLEVVAEGVETERQLNFLAARNCQKVQGYFFSVPIPPEEVSPAIIKWNQTMRNSATA